MPESTVPFAEPQAPASLFLTARDVRRDLTAFDEAAIPVGPLPQAGGCRGRMQDYLEIAERLAEAVVDVHRYPLGPRYDEMVFEHEDIVEVCYFDWTDLPGANSRLSNNRFVIGINGNDSPERQRFTLYHEWFEVLFYPHMGYYLEAPSLFWWARPRFESLLARGNQLSWRSSRSVEQAANRFAACVLMPGFEVMRLWLDEGVRSIRELAATFRVSPCAMRRRLRELGLIAPSPSKGRTSLPTPARAARTLLIFGEPRRH